MESLTYRIIEYQRFKQKDILDYLKNKQSDEETSQNTKDTGAQEREAKRAENFFKALQKFADREKNQLFIKHSKRDELKAQNYVGIIQTPYGTLEIFPKCFKDDHLKEDSEPKDQAQLRQKRLEYSDWLKKAYEFSALEELNFEAFQTPVDPKNLLFNFLKALKKTHFKPSQIASLQTSDLPLLDIFIQMFAQELHTLIQKGIRHDYITKENNRFYLKGKLIFKEQIRHNTIHQERFFTASDEFIANIPENRLIKTTLLFLKNKTTYPLTLTSLNGLLSFFDDIPRSNDPLKDFSLLKPSRHFDYYQNTLQWCKLFLQEKHFAPYSGEDSAYALLFPTEKLFESYFASMLKQNNPDLNIKLQHGQKYFLQDLQTQSVAYSIQPDLWIEGKQIIIDTKWKTEDKGRISQADLYQMWAYACKYKAKEVWIIYPLCEKTEELQKKAKQNKWIFKAGKNLTFLNKKEAQRQGIQDQESWMQENQKIQEQESLNQETEKSDLQKGDADQKGEEIKFKILFAPLPFF